MESLLGLCFGILIVGCVLGIIVGYTMMAIGIGEGLGIPIGIIAFVTILGVFILAFFGIWYNQKIYTGAAILGGSISILLILSLFIR